MNQSPKETFEIYSETILKDLRKLKKFALENYLINDYENLKRDIYYER